MKIYHSFSSEETKKFGASVARQLSINNFQFSKKKQQTALVLELKGDLGSGKTTFTQGFLRGLRVRGRVSSPTFVLIKHFTLHGSRFKNAYHIDCYRIKKASELGSLGLKEILADPKNIVLIEWPEKVKWYLSKNAFWVEFKYGRLVSERVIIFS